MRLLYKSNEPLKAGSQYSGFKYASSNRYTTIHQLFVRSDIRLTVFIEMLYSVMLNKLSLKCVFVKSLIQESLKKSYIRFRSSNEEADRQRRQADQEGLKNVLMENQW